MGEKNLLAKLKAVIDEVKGLENYQREIYNNALDIEDFEVSQKTQSDAYIKIRQLKEWGNILANLNAAMGNSNILEEITDENDEIIDIVEKDEVMKVEEPLNTEGTVKVKEPVTDVITKEIVEETTDHKEEKEVIEVIVNNVEPKYTSKYEPNADTSEDNIKIDEYIRDKMRFLSNKKFEFTDNDIKLMQGKSWSKDTLGLRYPFMKIYYDDIWINKQIKDEFNYVRYWKEIFEFGKHKVLIANYWSEKNRADFNKWYESINSSAALINREQDNLETFSYVDSSLNNKNITMKLLDKPYTLSGWNEVLVKVCQVMMLARPYIFARFDKEPDLNNDEYTNFSYKESEIKGNRKRLSNGLWIRLAGNKDEIIKLSKRMLKICGYAERDLVLDF